MVLVVVIPFLMPLLYPFCNFKQNGFKPCLYTLFLYVSSTHSTSLIALEIVRNTPFNTL